MQHTGSASTKAQAGGSVGPKDNLMFFIVIGLWVLTLLYFNPRLFVLLIGPENILAKLGVVVFIICLDIFWFYAIFYIAIITFSYFHKKKTLILKPVPHPHPNVAILYTTYNDFQAESVLSCLEQDYDNFHVFVLDDSTDEKYINTIDRFAEKFKNRITILRRKERIGYKAGNINHALRIIGHQFEYFAIADADSVFPSDFITTLLPYFSASKDIGFVQAMHRVNPEQKTQFVKIMSFNLDLHYKRYLLPKEKYGFVMFYGHSALIRMDVCRKIGGFPEIVSEDLAFSTVMRRHGYRGVLAEDYFCYESFPETYRQYRHRNEKWIKGTLEFLFKEYPLFLRCKSISWFEKLDVFVSAVSLILGFPFLLFLLIAGIVLPLYFASCRLRGPFFIPAIPQGKTTVSAMMGLRYNVYWATDFYIMMLLVICYPLIPVLIDWWKKPLKMLEYMAISTFVSLSSLVHTAVHFLSFIITKKADFLVTGHENYFQSTGSQSSGKNNPASKYYAYKSNRRLIPMLEIVFAGIFLVAIMTTRSLWLIAVALSLLLSPLLLRWSFEKRFLRYLSFVPFLLSILLLILIGKAVFQ